jgi:hypothetical protein
MDYVNRPAHAPLLVVLLVVLIHDAVGALMQMLGPENVSSDLNHLRDI